MLEEIFFDLAIYDRLNYYVFMDKEAVLRYICKKRENTNVPLDKIL